MMLTPWGPRAVPTGGAGVAAPAGTCSLTMALIFLAISSPVASAPYGATPAITRAVAGAVTLSGAKGPKLRSGLFAALRVTTLVSPQLQIVQLYRRGPPEQAHRNPDLSLVRQHLFHRAAEVGERALGDLDDLPDQERDLLLRLGLRDRLGD